MPASHMLGRGSRGIGLSDDDELLARAWEILQRRAKATAAPTITVAGLYARYVEAMKSHRSWKTIEMRIRTPVKVFGERDVMSLRVSDWAEYRAAREKTEIPTGKPGRFYGPHTINIELWWFRALFNWAAMQGLITHNPLAGAKAVKHKSKRSTAISEHDIEEALRNAGPELRVLILCAVDGGMRRTEILRMRWDWIDREKLLIRLPGWACKSGNPRAVAITSRALAAIDALPRHLRSPFVLVNPDTGEPFGTTTASRWFRDAADAAGLEAAPQDRRVVLHDLRRTHGTLAVRRGVRIDVVSKQLGHASLDQTRDYVEVDEEDVMKARADFEGTTERDKGRGPHRAADSDSDGREKTKRDKK